MKLILDDNDVHEAILMFVEKHAKGWTPEGVDFLNIHNEPVDGAIEAAVWVRAEGDEPEFARKGELCSECGAGPFVRLASHTRKMHNMNPDGSYHGPARKGAPHAEFDHEFAGGGEVDGSQDDAA